MGNCSYCLDNTLHYTYPVNNGWVMKNIPLGLQVPEGHELFMVPLSCGRNPAIATQYQGTKHKLSFYILDETDMVTGNYEETLVELVDELLETLPVRPRALLIMATCLADLIGIDYDPIMATIQKRHPDVKIAHYHVTPLDLEHTLAAFYSIHQMVYGLLDPPTRRDGQAVNFIGNLRPVDVESEIYGYLRQNGITKANHISDFETYDGFQSMSEARLNLVIANLGMLAAEDMQQNLGIPFARVPQTYHLDRITKHYGQLAESLGLNEPFDCTEDAKRAREAIDRALAAVGDIPLAVDYNGSRIPYDLAHALLTYGFDVKYVFSEQPLPEEEADYEGILKDYPDTQILEPQHPRFVNGRFDEPNSIAIGTKAGALLETKHIVQIFSDETLYGFFGVRTLMEMIIKAAHEETDYRTFEPLDDARQGELWRSFS
jgi:nitrogenase molybdenum-iron protein alpha/beta subunit